MVNLTLTSLWDNPFMHITVPKVVLGYRTSCLIKFNAVTTKFKITCRARPSIHITKSIIAVSTRESKSRINDPSKSVS